MLLISKNVFSYERLIFRLSNQQTELHNSRECSQESKTQRPESSTMWRFILECREGSRSRLYREDSLADAFSDTASVLDLDLIGCCARLRRMLHHLPFPLRRCLLCCCHFCLHDPCALPFHFTTAYSRLPLLLTPGPVSSELWRPAIANFSYN